MSKFKTILVNCVFGIAIASITVMLVSGAITTVAYAMTASMVLGDKLTTISRTIIQGF